MSVTLYVIFLHTSFDLVQILVEGSNQSKDVDPEQPFARAKAPTATRDKRPDDENDFVLVASFFPTITVA